MENQNRGHAYRASRGGYRGGGGARGGGPNHPTDNDNERYQNRPPRGGGNNPNFGNNRHQTESHRSNSPGGNSNRGGSNQRGGGSSNRGNSSNNDSHRGGYRGHGGRNQAGSSRGASHSNASRGDSHGGGYRGHIGGNRGHGNRNQGSSTLSSAPSTSSLSNLSDSLPLPIPQNNGFPNFPRRGDHHSSTGRGAHQRPNFESLETILNKLPTLSPTELLSYISDPRGSIHVFLHKHEPSCTILQVEKLFQLFSTVLKNESAPQMINQFLIDLIDSNFTKNYLSQIFAQELLASTGRMQNFGIFLSNLLFVLSEAFTCCGRMAHSHLLPLMFTFDAQIANLKQSQPHFFTEELTQSLTNLKDYREAAEKWSKSMVDGNSNRSRGVNSKQERLLLRADLSLPPDNFRQLSVTPTAADIHQETKEVFLRRNIINGSYENVEQYLDIHFRLMREDFVQPLRNGIKQYLQYIEEGNNSGGGKRKRFDLHVYSNVEVNYTFPDRKEGIIHVLNFDIKQYPRVNWKITKRLSYGSLVCLSTNNFEQMHFGIIVMRDVEDLMKGLVPVKFTTDETATTTPPQSLLHYVMVEANVFFEAYRHTLSRLKELTDLNFPLKDALLGTMILEKKQPELPRFLRRDATQYYNLQPIAMESVQKSRSPDYFKAYPMSLNKWPHHDDLGFDESQFVAFKNALTKEISLIQGPPGTGKTYVGLKITQCLLQMQAKHANFGPILIVCYTNHALDQFLEGILHFCPQGIVRVGNRCKSEELEKFNLKTLRHSSSIKSSRYQFFHAQKNLYAEMEKLEASMNQQQKSLKKAQSVLLNINELHDVIPTKFMDELEQCSTQKSKAIANWLLGVEDLGGNWGGEEEQEGELFSLNQTQVANDVIEMIILQEIFKESKDIVEDFRYNLDELNDELGETIDVEDDIDFEMQQRNLFNEQDRLGRSRKKFRKEMEEPIGGGGGNASSSYQDEFESETGWCQSRSRKSLNRLIKHRLGKEPMKLEEVQPMKTILNLPISQRWKLYNYWRHVYIDRMTQRIQQTEQAYEIHAIRNKELEQLNDKEILEKSQIIGMTTTGAARYGKMLCEIQPKIVIVEEAAEVLESHIVTSLSQGTQHLILIGDHLQLKPNTAVYELSKTYKLDVSLFERLINFNFPYDTLAYQHRMRPEIARLMKHIYEKLQNHPCVEQYEMVLGLEKNIFFINHQHPEGFQDDIRSYTNAYEADYIKSLCYHLLCNGYHPEQITILTLYSGQLLELKRRMPKSQFQGIRVSVVDNFQGEENDIILLSLVRSNSNDSIGFLSIQNRICVALSRAKKGLYVIGNFDMLSQASPMWNNMVNEMKDIHCFGANLILSCQIHDKESTIITCPEDFAKAPEGGCHKLCQERLSCGHACRMSCHPLDRQHEHYCCTQPCTKLCDKNQHPCPLKCFQKCNQCQVKVKLTMPQCGHQTQASCFEDVKNVKCQHACDKVLLCGHKCQKKCFESCTIECAVKVEEILPFCGHRVFIPCWQTKNLWTAKCSQACGGGGLPVSGTCGHPCKGTCSTCSNGRLHRKCLEPCERVLICGHICTAGCSQTCPPCQKPCENACLHNKCKKKCQDICIPCHERCAWSCKHLQCTKLCYEKCNRTGCNEPCEKTFVCHKCHKQVGCIGLCGEPCPKYKCRECNASEWTDLVLSGNEDDPEARFIYLENCKHVIEVEAMDRWVQQCVESEDIKNITCPRCSARINKFNTNRYRNLLIKSHEIQQKVIVDLMKKQENVNVQLLVQQWESLEMKIQRFRSFFGGGSGSDDPLVDSVAKQQQQQLGIARLFFVCKNQIDELKKNSSTAFIKSSACYKCLKEICKLQELLNKEIMQYEIQRANLMEFYNHVKYSMLFLILWIIDWSRSFDEHDLNLFSSESRRLECLIVCLNVRVRAILSKSKEGALKKLENESDKLMKAGVGGLNLISQEKYDAFYVEINKIKDEMEIIPGLYITKQERDEIQRAMGFAQGHWFKCPNGHIYAIGECGGAMQKSTCPECRAPIGGENHHLTEGNDHSGEMDGSTRPHFDEAENNEIMRRLRGMNLF